MIRTKCRQVIRTAYDPEYRRALERQQTRKGKHMGRVRQSTVEPVYGTLVNYYGMGKVGVKGKAGAHKVMLMAVIAFNLKKYMKFEPVKVKSMAIALERVLTQPFTGNVLFLIVLFYRKNKPYSGQLKWNTAHKKQQQKEDCATATIA